ncbi:TIGR03086 family metal-binding protein [Aeromicrobium stalagmiti]|uniref:TIGR03086 family metal-binding protein n=1 Tax=Aeromicrobium stalagmiti TaxID=2738988 RepID=UPI00156A4947|nr:TIGR03086 family metal-binding protein [Aeromicrobium stalagmiti]NRQ51699.1 TIGR03086 family protein [Aeromicrobium stalagmiti]
MPNPDLTRAAAAMADLLAGVRDDQLGGPTPCPALTVGDLVAHVHGLTQAFAAAAAKDLGPLTSTPPSDGVALLPDDWRETAPGHLDGLATAWRDPVAWTGMTAAGGVDLPGEVAGLVAADEIVVHGWDLAQATGQDFDPGEEALAAAHAFLVESRKGPVPAELFGPEVSVPSDAPLFDRVVGLAGRDPGWTP